MPSLKYITKHPITPLLESCTTLHQFKQLHTQLLVNGLLNDSLFLGKFVSCVALSHPKNLHYSTLLINQSKNPTIFALNSVIRAYSKSTDPVESFKYYNQILHSNLSPDNYTFTFLVRTCTQLRSRDTGPAVHAAVVKHGFHHDGHVQSCLIHMYAELGSFDDTHQLFVEIPHPDLVIQTAMLRASVGSGDMQLARKLFDEMPQRDPIAWNAMIAGYAQHGEPREALNLFNSMQIDGVEINEVTMVSVLSACAHLGAIDHGKWGHVYIEKNKLRMTVTLGTSLVDMYSKCGDMERAMEVFWNLKDKNVFSWSSVMGGLAMNGDGLKCLDMFTLMIKEGISPNEVTFVSVLRGCSVVGLVKEGRKHFELMKSLYGLEPKLEHYGCMVDLYGRAGHLIDAINFINSMPMKPHAGAWGALLNACKIHGNTKLGEFAMSKILELEPKNHGAYVLLSNIYADSKNWGGVISVRRLMKANGVKKVPGCSVIEVGGQVHEFFVGDKSHYRYGEIEKMWGEISRRLRLEGYVANTNQVFFDIEEEEKEGALWRHSERVAIAFGFVNLSEGETIRIVKNIRACGDCHDVTKIISRVFGREIVVRDRNRFHHFKDGGCSCKDYW